MQDIVFLLLYIFLLYKRKYNYFVIAGLLCLIFSIPLFSFWIFYTAQKLSYYSVVFFSTAIFILFIQTNSLFTKGILRKFIKKTLIILKLSLESLGEKIKKNLIISKLYKYLNLVHPVVLWVVIPLLLFSFAFFYRGSYFLDIAKPQNYFFYTLGSGSDNDSLIRYGLQKRDGTINPRNEVAHDYLFTLPVLAFLLNKFDFIQVLYIVSLFLILLSSIVSVIPYFVLNKLNKYSVGGLIISVLLVSNSFLSATSVSLIIDTITTFIYTLAVLCLILSFYYRKIIFILLFSFFILLNTFHRPPFGMNDIAFCGLFFLLYIFSSSKKIRFTKKNILFAITPLTLFICIYGSWEVYHYIRFGMPYAVGNAIFTVLNIHPRVVDDLAVMYRNESEHFLRDLTIRPTSLTETIDNAFTFLTTNLLILLKRAQIPLFIIGITSIVIILDKKKKLITNITYYLRLFLGTTFGFYAYYKVIVEDSTYTYHAANWSFYDILYMSLFILIAVYVFVKVNNIRIIILMSFMLFLLVGLGSTTISSWRHHIPLSIWIIFIIGMSIEWSINKLIINPHTKKVLFYITLIILAIYYSPAILTNTLNMYTMWGKVTNEKKYYSLVNHILPSNAVVMGDSENIILVAESINKPLIYNGQWPFHLISKERVVKQISFNDFIQMDNLYLLDSSKNYWENYVLDVFTDKSKKEYIFTLKKLENTVLEGRSVYKLNIEKNIN